MKPSFLLERRQSQRTKVEGITSINLNSNNGGILSNLSEGGLCFHVAHPVQQGDRLRVWFLENGFRIEADVESVWTDEGQKTGGFRFISLSPQTRDQIRMMCRSKEAVAERKSIAPVPKPPSSRPNSIQPARTVAPDLPRFKDFPSQKTPANGYFRGLLTGFVISSLLGAALVLSAHHRWLGTLLIQLGERFLK